MRHMIWIIALAGCSIDETYIDGFSPPSPSPGHTRMVAPPVHDLAPGDDVTYCQWLTEPAEVARQLVNVEGHQSHGGHHLVLYATTVHEPVGTSRICTDEDMVSITFVGAVGGEGNTSAVQLPPGYAFELPQGMALMANTHYFNASDNMLDAQSVADVQFGDPARPLAPVGFLAVSWNRFKIPAERADYTSEASCTATRTLSFILWTNHMHEIGASMYSEVIRQDGSVVPLANDPMWSPEQAFNAPWVKWDPASAMVVNAGDRFHVSCTWRNTTGVEVTVPREMCVASGFTLEAMPQSICAAQ
jgi:hypothetical protein